MFDIKDIEIVRAVVDHGGFRAAAARLRLSQSAVSARVASLEERLGMELLDRRKRRGRLTPAGRSFLEQAVRLTEMRDRIVTALAHESGFAGTIRIGVAETIVHTWLPQMMTAVRDRFPQLRIELSVDTSRVLADKLLQDDLDFAVMMEELVPPHSAATFVYASAIDWFAAADIDFAERRLTVDELAKWPIVTFPKGTVPYRDIERLFAEADLAAMPLLHGCASLSTALHLVRNGFGIGVLPNSMAAADVLAGRIRRLATSEAAKPRALRFVLCHLPATDRTLAAALREMIRDAVAQAAEENHMIFKIDHNDQKMID